MTRGLWPDQNPLRRGTDRAEAAIIAGLIAAFVVGAPVAAVTAGHSAAMAGLRDEQTARYKVPATLLLKTPAIVVSPFGVIAVPAPAEWTAPDGAMKVGLVNVRSAARAGATVTIWTSKSGRIIGPRPPPGLVRTHAVLTALAAFIGTGLVLFVCGLVAITCLQRRRLAAWDAAWREAGPRWTSRT